MITIEDIKKWSKPHPMSKYLGNATGGKGRMSRFGNSKVTFSIVGGDRGLYGNFEDTFEVAIFDNENGNFITRFFYPDTNDDVIDYMEASDVEELVNSVIKRGALSVVK